MAPNSKTSRPKAKRLSVDFKRVKSKVGRKLPPPKNATKVEIKSKAIVLPGQSVAQDKDGVAVNQRRQSLKELLVQSSHYNERTRRDSMMGLKNLFTRHPKELVMHAMAVIEKLSPRIADSEKSVRDSFLLLLRSSIFPGLPQAMMQPLVPVIMTHLGSAMTHLVLDVRVAASSFLDLLIQHSPSLVIPVYLTQIFQHYTDLFGEGGVSAHVGATFLGVLKSLEHFVSFLNQSMPTQISGSSCSASTHHWGHMYKSSTTSVDDQLQALHGYKSVVAQGLPSMILSSQKATMDQLFVPPTSGDETVGISSRQVAVVRSTGIPLTVAVVAKPLVLVLLECWAECAPVVCMAPVPDVSSLDCMVLIIQALCHIIQSMKKQCFSVSSTEEVTRTWSVGNVPKEGCEDFEMQIYMQQEYLSALIQKLLKFFPITAPSVPLSAKMEEGLVALNIGMCQVMLELIHPGTQYSRNNWLNIVLQYFESALYGMVLPPSEFASVVTHSKLSEYHMKSLIRALPGIMACISHNWMMRLLKAFTHVFETCSARSSTKLACLYSMTEMLLPQKRKVTGLGEMRNVLLEIHAQWLQSLPKLLWELKLSQPTLSQAVLEMLLYVGRSSPDGSALGNNFTSLQQEMIPFFCTFVNSSGKDEVRSVYGPFINLSKDCQELAIDLLYYYSRFSALFLRALAQCCLCPDAKCEVVMRTVEVLQKAFLRGAVGLGEHLSFLFTLLVGHTATQSCAPETISEAAATINDHDESVVKRRRIQSARTGVVCACLSQLGDGNLVLKLLSPSIAKELGLSPPLEVVCGLFRVVAVLSHRDTETDGLYIPQSLSDVLAKSLAKFLLTLSEFDGGNNVKTQVKKFWRPCIILLSRSHRFTQSVLSYFHMCLEEELRSRVEDHKKLRLAISKTLLEMFKIDSLDICLTFSRDAITQILQLIQGHYEKDLHTNEGEELKTLHFALQRSASALFGVKVASQLTES